MNLEQVTDTLRMLPPQLPSPADRFEQIHARVRRRRRRQAGVAAALGAAAIAVVLAVPSLSPFSGRDHATDSPVDPAASRHAAPTGQTLPGQDELAELADRVTTTGSGTQTVALGDRPPGATAVRTELSCLSAGTIGWPDGASMSCDAQDVKAAAGSSRSMSEYTLPLASGQTSIVITAHQGVAWRLTTTYVQVVHTEWGVNAKGDTYGVENDQGSPDLLAVDATNGKSGYAYVTDLDGPQPTSPADAVRQQATEQPRRTIPVYTSDGTTQIGVFQVDADASAEASAH